MLTLAAVPLLLAQNPPASPPQAADWWARTPIEMEAPLTLDTPGETVTVKVGAARGQFPGMLASRAYVLDVHLPAKPASVTLGGRSLPMFDLSTGDRAAQNKVRASFNAATEGWLYDAGDRSGVLHVKAAPQSLATGFTTVIAQ
jgi:alpha-glucosidase